MTARQDKPAGAMRGNSLAVLGAGTFAGYLLTSISWVFFCLQENADLLKADKSSQIWLDYVGYIDGIVLDGLFRLVHKSLQLLLTNMAPDVGPGLPCGVVPILCPYSGCPTTHCLVAKRAHPSASWCTRAASARGAGVPLVPAVEGPWGWGTRWAQEGVETHGLLTCFRPMWPHCSRCAWSCATAECGTIPRWRRETTTASWSWWRACSVIPTRLRHACLGCWRGS